MENITKLLVDKISEYEVINNFIPGIIFVWAYNIIIGVSINGENLMENICVYYVIGLAVGRVGSIILEPLMLMKIKGKAFAIRAEYTDYMEAEKVDSMVRILNSKNNLYRSLLATSFCLLLLDIAKMIMSQVLDGQMPSSSQTGILIVSLLLSLLFAFSYRKQTDYIKRRVEKSKKTQEGD